MPGKIKVFGWRALNGLLPCKAILANRHISPTGGCPVCNNGAEDIKHMIFLCDRARLVWNSMGIGQTINELLGTDRSGSIVLEEVIRRREQVQSLEVGLAELILTGGWFLWWERRQLVHGEAVQRPQRFRPLDYLSNKEFQVSSCKRIKDTPRMEETPRRIYHAKH